jgi:hypothetical protein
MKAMELSNLSDSASLSPNWSLFGGIVIGIGIGLGIYFLLFRYLRGKGGSVFSKYDERQKAAQGKAYRNGYWTLVGLLALWYVANLCDIWLPSGRNLTILIVMLAGVLVYVVSCILMDAYIGLNDNRKRSIISLSVVGVLNLVLAVISRSANSSSWMTNLLVGVMTLVVLAAIGVKILLEHRNGGEEE